MIDRDLAVTIAALFLLAAVIIGAYLSNDPAECYRPETDSFIDCPEDP